MEVGKYNRVLRALMPEVPKDIGELPQYFQTVEGVFMSQQVPQELRGKLLFPFLGRLATPLLANLTQEDLADYEKIKIEILKRNKLTPAEYRKRFDEARKRVDETWLQFVERINSLWLYYIKSRSAEDFDSVNNLVVLDRLKAALPADTRRYVNLQEADKVNSYIDSAYLAEVYESAVKEDTKSLSKPIVKFSNEKYRPPFRREMEKGNEVKKNFSNVVCFKCKSKGHMSFDCPRRVNEVRRMQCEQKDKNVSRRKSEKSQSDVIIARVRRDMWKINEDKRRKKFNELQYIDVLVHNKKISALIDSGTEISVINEKWISKNTESTGSIQLSPAFGKPIKAKLFVIPISLVSNEKEKINTPVDIVVASTELNGDMLLTPSDYRYLKEQEEVYAVTDKFRKEIEIEDEWCLNELFKEETGKPNETVIESSELFKVNKVEEKVEMENEGSNEVKIISKTKQFQMEQRNCSTLKNLFQEVKEGKSNAFWKDDLLYYKGTVGGSKVSQLVVPKNRRNDILSLAHQSMWGGHLGCKKTAERIKYTFFWPEMNKDIKEFCNTCEECQLTGRIKVADRVPITPITRPKLPFDVVNCDLIGPFEAKSGRNHRYALTMVDQHTRWAECVPLKSLSAKETCEALLTIFSRTGIPRVIASDQGTNFTSALTQEFYKAIGSSPRFSTPGHPESNGLVERFNGCLKKMLHHIIRKDAKNWDKKIPFILWAYREVPHSTTGVSPFKLLYGREPRGPLTILKEVWTDEVRLPELIKEPIHNFLAELRQKMEEAAEIAELTCKKQQTAMAEHYNLRSRKINYEVGDKVLLLIPDSSSKLLARWTGPGKIIEKPRPNSYVVETDDGIKRYVHANKIRHYKVRVQQVGVIFEDDEEIGEVNYIPLNHDILQSLPSHRINVEKLRHLSHVEQNEILDLLDNYQLLFSGNMRRALAGKHKIKLKPDAIWEKPYLYRIPEVFKPEVDKQIEELLERKLIRVSQSEFAHPVVCVAKKNGQMRLCIDFRKLNAVSEIDPFPMENAKELLYEVARTRYITTLDMLKGYWLIPMEETSCQFTSFVTHSGQYEWVVMPFGLAGAAATFQRVMNEVLKPHKLYARAYIDDIAIFSNTWEEHLKHLNLVLRTLDMLNFSVNLEKCSFANSKVKYLGHVIGSGQHEPDPKKLEAIKLLKPPRTKKELRSVLGLCNYYRDYLPNYAQIVLPLTELTRRRVATNIPWPESAQKAFEELKTGLCQAIALNTPEIGKPFLVYTDASDIGVGACLAQKNDKGEIAPIAFASQKLTDTQKNWAIAEREAYAVIWALKKFEVWIFGSKIEVITDHNPLTFVTKSTSPSPKLQRWALALSRYDLTITHRKGSLHQNADALSRLVDCTSSDNAEIPDLSPSKN